MAASTVAAVVTVITIAGNLFNGLGFLDWEG
jgi:hypothetical protein